VEESDPNQAIGRPVSWTTQTDWLDARAEFRILGSGLWVLGWASL